MPGPGRILDAGQFLVSFFKPLAKIVRDWFPFLLLSACYYALYTNLTLRVNPHTADAALSKLTPRCSAIRRPFCSNRGSIPGLTDFFNLVYFSYVFSLPVVALYFYLGRDPIGVPPRDDGISHPDVDGSGQLHTRSRRRPGIYFADRYTTTCGVMPSAAEWTTSF